MPLLQDIGNISEAALEEHENPDEGSEVCIVENGSVRLQNNNCYCVLPQKGSEG